MAGTISEFYSETADAQWSRFESYCRIEEHVLRRTLERHLPALPARIADIGGGNGRHAFYLSDRGYTVRMCDVTPALVDDARNRNAHARSPLKSIEVCDARSLTWPDDSFDAALALGPMYCLRAPDDRAAVLREIGRVLRPGAPVVLQYFLRVAALRSLLETAAPVVGIFDWRTFLQRGVLDDERIPDMMRVHYFTTVREARAELKQAGLEIVEMRGMDGPSPGFGQACLRRAPTAIAEQWGEISYAVGGAAENISASTHLMVVARSPDVAVSAP